MNHFEANLAIIATNAPRLAGLLKETAGGSLLVSPARNGRPTARHNDRWVHSAYDPLHEAQMWAAEQGAARRPGETAVIFGVGLLYHVDALLERCPADQPIVVIVPDLGELHDACTARPLPDSFKRVRWAFGTPAGVAGELAALGQPLRMMTYGPAMACRQAYQMDCEQQLRRHIASRSGGQLRAAVVGPIYGGSLPIARYAVRALEELGHKACWIDHSVHGSSYAQLAKLGDPRHRHIIQSRFADVLSQSTLAQLAEEPPDVVLALAQAPLTAPVLQHLRRKKFLCAMWFVENYRHLTYWQQMAASYDFWFVIQKEPCRTALRHAGARDVGYVPMAADPSIHRPLALSPEDRVEFGSDLSFVGAGYPNRRSLLPKLISSDWTFKVWGNEWEGADGLQTILQRGGARIDTATCVKVFNASRINLNVHSCSGMDLDPEGDFINPRTFELAACGAFQLVDTRSLLREVFTPNEVVAFHAIDEVPAAVRRWLRDPDARASMAEAARKRVLAEHTYVHRMKEILSHIGMSQPDRISSILHGGRQAGALAAQCADMPTLRSLLSGFPSDQRVELKDVAERIKAKASTASLAREELLLLLLNEYRTEVRDML